VGLQRRAAAAARDGHEFAPDVFGDSLGEHDVDRIALGHPGRTVFAQEDIPHAAAQRFGFCPLEDPLRDRIEPRDAASAVGTDEAAADAGQRDAQALLQVDEAVLRGAPPLHFALQAFDGGLQLGLRLLERADVGDLRHEADDLAVDDIGQVGGQAVPLHSIRARHDALEALRLAAQRCTHVRLVQREEPRPEELSDRAADQQVRIGAEPQPVGTVGEAAQQVAIPVGHHRRRLVDQTPHVVGDVLRSLARRAEVRGDAVALGLVGL
jgi:hypothetical protein